VHDIDTKEISVVGPIYRGVGYIIIISSYILLNSKIFCIVQ